MADNMITVGRAPSPLPPSEPAVVFLDKHINDVHPTFRQLQPVYSNEDGKFVDRKARQLVSIDETEEMRRQQRLFMEAVAKFEQSRNGVKTGINLDVSAANGWVDVLNDLQSIENRYHKGENDAVPGRIRRCLRGMRRYRQPCEQWLKLLPSESWQGSLLCGGLRLVLNAANMLNLMLEEITDAIEQIPFTIEIVFRVSRVYNTEAMQSHVSQLFVTVLELLQECLVWLKKNAARKGLSAMVKGDQHVEPLRQKRLQLEKLQERIDKYADAGLHESVKDINQRTRSSEDVLNNLYSFITSDQNQLLADAELAREQSRRERESYKTLMEQTRMLLEVQKRIFLEAIEFDPTKRAEDLAALSTASPETYLKAQDRAAYILQHGQIGVWLLDSRSQVMIINSREAEHDRQSPVSLIFATIVRSLTRAKSGMVLCWSCARNIHGCAEDIVRNMVGQLLQSGDRDLALEMVPFLTRTNVDDFDEMIEMLLKMLTIVLNTTPVFIVIDSISFYEDRRRLAETRQLFDELHRLVDAWDGRCPLKVLASSPTRCSYLGTFIDEWRLATNLLSVPETVEGNRMRRMSLALPLLQEH